MGLLVSDKDQEFFVFKSFQRALELLLPIDPPALPQFIPLGSRLRFGRRDEPAKILADPMIVIMYLLVNSRPDEFAHA